MKKITLALMLFCSISLSAQNNSVPIEINEMFRDIEIPDTNGVKIKLSDYCAQGYYTLIEFGVSWCRHSNHSTNVIKNFYEKYHCYGFNIISIFLDEEREKWINFIDRHSIKWIHLSELKGWKNSEAAQLYNIKIVPYYILVHPTGRVAFIDRGCIYDKQLRGINNLDLELKRIFGY